MLNLGENAKLNVKQTEDAMLRLGLDPKLSEQERTPVDKRTKRLTRKTQKALEAAEVEQLLSPVKKSKKRKALPLPLSVKPTHLIVRIPLLEKHGAEMATDGVDGKENNAPANCKKESWMALRKEAREREERGKEGEEMKRSKLTVRMPLLENKEPDNSQQESWMAVRKEVREREERGKEGEKMKRSKLIVRIPFLQNKEPDNSQQVHDAYLTPSYCTLPVEEPPSTNRTDLERSVLNDKVRLVRRPITYHRKLSNHEKDLLHNEDMRFELDMYLEIVRATIKKVEVWINDMNCGSGKLMENYFSAQNRRCIEILYGEQGLEMVEMLQKKPDVALPIILARLCQKLEEVD
ncbi:uncharacterized protein LOC144572847 isoform X2 [Carex rostrata]